MHYSVPAVEVKQKDKGENGDPDTLGLKVDVCLYCCCFFKSERFGILSKITSLHAPPCYISQTASSSQASSGISAIQQYNPSPFLCTLSPPSPDDFPSLNYLIFKLQAPWGRGCPFLPSFLKTKSHDSASSGAACTLINKTITLRQMESSWSCSNIQQLRRQAIQARAWKPAGLEGGLRAGLRSTELEMTLQAKNSE